MRLPISLCLLLFTAVANVPAEPSWQLQHKKMTGVYGIYGGGLGDPIAPTGGDQKIMFAIEGKTARDMFDAMGPDVRDACTEQTKDRVRKKDHERLFCMRTAKGEYYCNFGFDLRTGKSIGGVVC